MSAATTITSAPSGSVKLTSNDASVLQALFDAESSPSASSKNAKVDPSLPSFPTVLESDVTALKSRELNAIRQIQQTNDSRLIEKAITELDTLISEFPAYPSAYVNRAQALRLLVQARANRNEEDSDSTLFFHENSRLATRLFSDLGQAISLSIPNRPQDSVSPAQSRLLADAHTHRGYLLLKAAKLRKEDNLNGGPEQLLKVESEDMLEEMASREFFQGGWYGNKVAQQLSVQTNPYAKMCGAIVKEALKKEMKQYF
jgi:hypothetical protein